MAIFWHGINLKAYFWRSDNSSSNLSDKTPTAKETPNSSTVQKSDVSAIDTKTPGEGNDALAEKEQAEPTPQASPLARGEGYKFPSPPMISEIKIEYASDVFASQIKPEKPESLIETVNFNIQSYRLDSKRLEAILQIVNNANLRQAREILKEMQMAVGNIKPLMPYIESLAGRNTYLITQQEIFAASRFIVEDIDKINSELGE